MSNKSTKEKAVLARINRKLAKELSSQRVRLCRENSRWLGEWGRFFITDLNSNFVVCQHVDLDDLARELAVL